MKKLKLSILLLLIAIVCTGCKKQETAEPAEAKTYESSVGWKMEYLPSLFELSEEGDSAEFKYTGKSSGEDSIKLSYYPGKMPNEVLYELTADISDDQISRSEGFFASMAPAWSYSRDITSYNGDANLGLSLTALEHNGGSLVVSILYTNESDDELNMEKSDNISGAIDTLEFTKHDPQEELAYMVGTYVHEYTEEIEGTETACADTITLQDDHFGKMEFQDDSDIIWTSTELICTEGNERYEFTVEGDMLYLNYDGEWMEFTKK